VAHDFDLLDDARGFVDEHERIPPAPPGGAW
jgi:hypothetical protein